MSVTWILPGGGTYREQFPIDSFQKGPEFEGSIRKVAQFLVYQGGQLLEPDAVPQTPPEWWPMAPEWLPEREEELKPLPRAIPLAPPPDVAPLENPEVLPSNPPEELPPERPPSAPPIAPPSPNPTRPPQAPPLQRPAPTAPPPPGQGPAETGVGVGVGPAFQPGTKPAPVPIGVDGRPISQPGAGPITTPENQTNIGTIVIPGTGPAPPPNLQGIATEVGKIERKLEVMLLRDAFQLPELPLQDLGPLFDAVEEILAILNGPYGSGVYQLVAPCQEGVIATANWPAGAGQFERLSAQVDALADLIQAHKNQRQPICATKASGQPVTVQFQEIG